MLGKVAKERRHHPHKHLPPENSEVSNINSNPKILKSLGDDL